MSSRLDQKTILIVEDEALVADWLAMVVEDEGAVVMGPYPTVRQARGQVEAAAVSAAILDVNLRDGEVTPLVGALRERRIPFIIHTGGILPARLREAIGKAPVFSKPTLGEAMIQAIEGLIARA